MHRTVVNAKVDEELDNIKQTYNGVEDLLNRTSQSIAATIPPQYSLDLNVIFFPQIGFLISLPIDPESRKGNYEGGDKDEERWDRIFSTSSRVYYKDYRMRELDETLGDMYATICGRLRDKLWQHMCSNLTWLIDREIEIIHELGQRVLAFEDMLNRLSDILGELDRWFL